MAGILRNKVFFALGFICVKLILDEISDWLITYGAQLRQPD